MNADIVEHGDEIISVGQLNQQAKKLLENQFKGISVLGEISNIARPSSGHIYFTLKDEDGAIRCAMFKNQNLRLNFEPQNGDQCVLKGQVSLYAPRGDYQLIVSSMQPAGAGDDLDCGKRPGSGSGRAGGGPGSGSGRSLLEMDLGQIWQL